MGHVGLARRSDSSRTSCGSSPTHRYNGGDFLVGNSFYHDQVVCDQFGTKLEKENDCQGVDDNYELSNIGRLT